MRSARVGPPPPPQAAGGPVFALGEPPAVSPAATSTDAGWFCVILARTDGRVHRVSWDVQLGGRAGALRIG